MEMEEVNFLQEVIDQDDIDTIVANLKNLGSGPVKPKGEVKKDDPPEKETLGIGLGNKLFGFKAGVAAQPRKSKELLAMEFPSEIKEVGVIEEMIGSEKRDTLVHALQNMINKPDPYRDAPGNYSLILQLSGSSTNRRNRRGGDHFDQNGGDRSSAKKCGDHFANCVGRDSLGVQHERGERAGGGPEEPDDYSREGRRLLETHQFAGSEEELGH